MKEYGIWFFVVLLAICLLMAVVGIYFLINFKTILRRWIRIEWLRQNIVAWIVMFCFFIAITPMASLYSRMMMTKGPWHALMAEAIAATVNVVFVFNIVRWVATSPFIQRMTFARQRIVILITLVFAVILFNFPLNYISGHPDEQQITESIIWSFYMATVTGAVYIMMSYLELNRNKKWQEKELEFSRLSELKTKAELEALHSKVNPHFLYNALNSIADLSITDGKKARRMTIALADLFRYSINYSQNNYSTINDELEMTEVYLQIEKIRFEDQLNYSVNVEEGSGHYLIPRFILQPLVENAVKHGLKVTGQMSEIVVEVKRQNGSLGIYIVDNGPAFPDEIVPRYGVKSVYDKLDLLFPGQYDIRFSSQPRKQVSIHIHKLIKNEPVV